MTIERKLLSTSPSDDAPDVAEAFSTHLYTGNGGTNVINNGIDLAGEGGMVWAKCRSATGNHSIFDTERGASKLLYGLGTAAETTSANSLTSFNSNGFTLGVDDTDGVNKNTRSHVGWTFRKKEKFFDVVTYTGNGVAGRTVAHNLGSVPGMMIIRNLANGYSWQVYHRSMANTDRIELDNTGAKSTGATTYWNSTTPTSSVFTLGTQNQVNEDGDSFVAYLFADNSAEDAEDQMIKCGIHSMPAGGGTVPIDLGWEPQFILMKDANHSQPWWLHDTMRGFAAPTGASSGTGGNAPYLFANSNAAESASTNGGLSSTGFTISSGQNYADGNTNFIYMAIRAPMMKEPEAATNVFALSNAAGGASTSVGFVPDTVFFTNTTQSSGTRYLTNRITGKRQLRTHVANAESSLVVDWDAPSGTWKQGQDSSNINLFWKRAKGFFDVVAYPGTNSVKTVAHSLGVVPEMIWVKRRNGATGWQVYTAEGAGSRYLHLDENYTYSNHSSRFNNTAATSSVFTVGTGPATNGSSDTYIAHLFATLAGISKCGTYTGNGSYQTISCGFSAGSRFILIKRTDADGSTSNWYVWDSARGIVAGNDPHVALNTTAAQVTNDDSIDPANSGFIVNQVSATNINVSSGTYIFYAIA